MVYLYFKLIFSPLLFHAQKTCQIQSHKNAKQLFNVKQIVFNINGTTIIVHSQRFKKSDLDPVINGPDQVRIYQLKVFIRKAHNPICVAYVCNHGLVRQSSGAKLYSKISFLGLPWPPLVVYICNDPFVIH